MQRTIGDIEPFDRWGAESSDFASLDNDSLRHTHAWDIPDYRSLNAHGKIDISPKQLVLDLLSANSGLAIGEIHGHIFAKSLLKNLMPERVGKTITRNFSLFT